MTKILDVNELEDLRMDLTKSLDPEKPIPPIIDAYVKLIESHKALHFRYQGFVTTLKRIINSEHYRPLNPKPTISGPAHPAVQATQQSGEGKDAT